MTARGWDYGQHPGDCCPTATADGVLTVCCRECAGTGVFPVPWIDEPTRQAEALCINCKATGRAVVTFAHPDRHRSTVSS